MRVRHLTGLEVPPTARPGDTFKPSLLLGTLKWENGGHYIVWLNKEEIMGQIPLPSYEQLRAIAKDDETLDAFLRGLVLNPPRQSPWARWRTRKLRLSAKELS